MKNITLERLELRNFKKIKKLDIDFKQVTNILGRNESGKTTVFDAFTWLLFDKDSTDRSQFDIKTLDENNEPLHGLDHSVLGILMVDGKKWTLQKTYKEKWVKKRGDVNKELTGHETVHEINGVPVSKAEYNSKVSEFLDADIFKLITNPLYFSTGLDWKKRRAILMDILGEVSDEQVIYYNEDLKPLEIHLENADIDTLLKQTKASKTKLNNEIKYIPTRIDEASRSIQDLDFKALHDEKKALEFQLEEIQYTLSDNSVNDEAKLKIKDEIYDLKNELKDFEYNYKNKQKEEQKPYREKVTILQDQLEDVENKIREANRKVTLFKKDLESFEVTLSSKKKEYTEVSKQELDIPSHIKECPTCKRAFDEGTVQDQIQSLEGNFKLEKSKKLERIIRYAESVKQDQTMTLDKFHGLEQEISQLKLKEKQLVKDLETAKSELENLPSIPFTEHEDYVAMEKTLSELEVKFRSDEGAELRKELKDKEMSLKTQIQTLNNQLAYEEQNKTLKDRITELEEELKELSQQFADLENIEYLCEQFIRTKVELLESQVNNKFDMVEFKLFNVQVNGGLAETCEALVNGVPYLSVNTAGKLNAGIDIINSLNEHFQVTAPIFLDNRESVTNIIESKSQIINLFVDPKEKKLRVEE